MTSSTKKADVLTREELLARAKQATSSPGVYLMKNANGKVLYIGKAKNLKNRLTSYFQSPEHPDSRIELWVQEVARFETILVQTESEALILEATLVKKYRPRGNVRLKDDKAYPYLKIQLSDDTPRIEWTRRVLKDGARYFGPFPSARSARQVLQLLNETFLLRDCRDNIFSHRSRPCILFQMNRCSAPCVNKISSEDYRQSVRSAVGVLEGKADLLLDHMKEEMMEAASQEHYEEAAQIRDQIGNLELITQTQSVLTAESQQDRDGIAIARKGAQAYAVALVVQGGKLTSVLHWSFQNMKEQTSDEELMREFLLQHYLPKVKLEKSKQNRKKKENQDLGEVSTVKLIADENTVLEHRLVLVDSIPKDRKLLEKTLGIELLEPDGAQERQLLDVARANAQNALDQSLRSLGGHGAEALEEVQAKLQLPNFPRRIECYDISNIQGTDPVASRVVFVDGAPDKNLYRRYKIRTVEGPNDFAMMHEVLSRRFSNSEEEMPDLVVVDGGKGQLSQAVQVLEDLNVQGVPVVGLAKAKTESSFESQEVRSSKERIFIPNRKNPVLLSPHTLSFRVLTHVRDEAHRFAVAYHRTLRRKRNLKT